MNQNPRLRVLFVTALIGVLAIPITASAGVSAPSAPADPITGQDHPGDVVVMGWQYLPSTVTIQQGETFKFANYDVVQGIPSHSIDEYIAGCTAPPYTSDSRTCPKTRFSSGLVDWMQVHEVRGTDKLKPGTYEFVCQVHPFMHGQLVVQ